jgi:hypothetical protein
VQVVVGFYKFSEMHLVWSLIWARVQFTR